MPANTISLADALDVSVDRANLTTANDPTAQQPTTHPAPHITTPANTPLAETVNLHVWTKCNLRCTYCYGRFPARPAHLPATEWCRILDLLAGAGVRRVTFSGGEPTLHPGLAEMLRHARRLGQQTSIITNGARLVRGHVELLDLVAVTVDSARPEVLERLGRQGRPGGGGGMRRGVEGGMEYLEVIKRVAAMTHDAGRRLKINTVVTQLNASEDLSELIRELRPAKWKPLQFVHVPGENDDNAAELAVEEAVFEEFVRRHEPVAAELGLWFAPETARTVQTTYVMIDPAGRVFQHGPDGHRVSGSVLDVGVQEALASVGGYDREAFLERGGAVDVRRLPVVGGTVRGDVK